MRGPWAAASVEFGQGLGQPRAPVSPPIPTFLGLWILLKAPHDSGSPLRATSLKSLLRHGPESWEGS